VDRLGALEEVPVDRRTHLVGIDDGDEPARAQRAARDLQPPGRVEPVERGTGDHEVGAVPRQRGILERGVEHLDGTAGEFAREEGGEAGANLDGEDARTAVQERLGGLTGAGAGLDHLRARCRAAEERPEVVEERGRVAGAAAVVGLGVLIER
jgi:hypothetical protein